MPVLSVVLFASPPAADAQQQAKPAPEQHDHGMPPKPSPPTQEGQVHDHSQMAAEHHGALSTREGSGTAWLPDASLMYAFRGQRGPWALMGHGNWFLQFLDDRGERPAWGRNEEEGQATNVFLLESNLTVADRDSWFSRFEIVAKTAHDLDVPHSLVHDVEGDETFTVAKLQAGYTRFLKAWSGLSAGVGASASAGFVPRTLEPVYGSRVNAGFGVFLTLRPAVMRIGVPPGAPHVH